jgi:hypothetical protein
VAESRCPEIFTSILLGTKLPSTLLRKMVRGSCGERAAT